MDDDHGSMLKRMQNKCAFEVEEIFTNILLRLPVKSLLICKCVCKYWRGYIGSPSFESLHLIRSEQNPTRINVCYPCFFQRDNKKYIVIEIDREAPRRFPKILFDGSSDIKMIGSFNGLVCFSNLSDDWKIHICNPAIGEVLLLPPAGSRSTLPYPRTFGVSFGPTIVDGYKVYQFFRLKDKLDYECVIYSSITRSWKSIGMVSHAPSPFWSHYSCRNHVCVNGIAYWLSDSTIEGQWVSHILAANGEERFSIISLPKQILTPFLINLEGCLSVVIQDGNIFEIWALQDSRGSAWVKKWSEQVPEEFYKYRLMHVEVQKKEVLFMSNRFYVVYDMGTSSWKNFRCNCVVGYGCKNSSFYLTMTHTESLLSPDKY